jgi:hypothetical protein
MPAKEVPGCENELVFILPYARLRQRLASTTHDLRRYNIFWQEILEYTAICRVRMQRWQPLRTMQDSFHQMRN